MAEEETPTFERDDYGDMDEGQSQSQYQVASNNLLVEPHCSTDNCTAAQEEPAEAAWVKLMSAVPQAGQIDSLKPGREGTMLLPEGKTIQELVSSIRPQPEADFALDTIRDEWAQFHDDFQGIEPTLKQGLTDLSSNWKGDDFDAFEEQVEIVLKNCRRILSDIGGENGTDGVVGLLDEKSVDIFEQQGGTACAYPAPKFYMEGTKCGSHRIHIRPPFYKSCVIEENDEIKHAVELAGFNPDVVDEVQEGRENRYQQWLEYVGNNPDYEENGLKGEQLARAKADEYADQALIDMGAKGSEQLEEQAAIVNEEVTEKHSNVEAQVQEIEPDAKPADPSEFGGDPGDLPGPPDLDGGPEVDGPPELGGDGPDLDGMSGPDSSNLDSLGPDGNGGFGGGLGGEGLGGNTLDGTTPPGGYGGGTPPAGYTGGDPNGLGDENPFNAGLDDPDNVGGPPPPDGYDGSGLTPPGGGTPPGGYTGGDLPPSSDSDEIGGGLASGGPVPPSGGPPPSSTGGPGLSGSGPGLFGGGPGPRHGSTMSPRGLTPRSGGTSGPRVLNSKATTGGTGLRPGSSTAGSGLRPGSSGSGGSLGRGAGSGGVGAAGGAGGGTGRGLGGPGSGGRGGGVHGAPGMLPGAGGAGKGDEAEHERQFFLVEDDDVWGGGPEFEEDDPYA